MRIAAVGFGQQVADGVVHTLLCFTHGPGYFVVLLSLVNEADDLRFQFVEFIFVRCIGQLADD